jgi:hypothetical protein
MEAQIMSIVLDFEEINASRKIASERPVYPQKQPLS